MLKGKLVVSSVSLKKGFVLLTEEVWNYEGPSTINFTLPHLEIIKT